MIPSFEVIPGDPESSVLLHVPHASRQIPDDVRQGIVLTSAELDVELTAITDARTDEIALSAANGSRLRPWVFVNRLSRLVVDPERFPDEREEMNAVGMGAVYERTTQLKVLRRPTEAQRAALIDTYFEPYAEALARLVRQRLEVAARVTILDVHSYPRLALPYERHGDGARPELCLGTDSFHTPRSLAAAARTHFGAVTDGDEVGLDSPFAGCYVPLDQYGVNRSVTALMLEIRRDVVESRLEALATATAGLVDRIDQAGA